MYTYKTILIYLYISAFLFPFSFFPKGIAAANNSGVNINARIQPQSYVSLFGFTSPNTIIEAGGIRTFGHSQSDSDGNFTLHNLPVAEGVREVCLTALDEANRISIPLCLALDGKTYFQNIGPVILPPTISLSKKEIFRNQKAY